jgi:hypothetical protein
MNANSQLIGMSGAAYVIGLTPDTPLMEYSEICACFSKHFQSLTFLANWTARVEPRKVSNSKNKRKF